MELINFLQKSIDGKLKFSDQLDFLESKQSVTAEELAETVRFLKSHMPRKFDLPDAVDVCGTGGSGLSRINTSTISAFILAGLGVEIAKHGNRASGGRFGSFDLLDSLGVNFKSYHHIYENEGLLFMFAPEYFSVMKHFAEMRKNIGRPTFFNILGPLLNPANVQRQIIGTAFRDRMQLIAETCRLLGRKKVYIVCGEDGLDEVTLCGKTFVCELDNGEIKNYMIDPEDFGVKRCEFYEIAGGDKDINTRIALDILKGKCNSRHVDLVLVNVALALKLSGKVKDLKEGYALARELVQKGIPYEKLESYKAKVNTPNILLEIVESKKRYLPLKCDKKGLKKSDRDFTGALKRKKVALIAEIKKVSPSEGKILSQNFPVSEIAKIYENSYASAISVVCEKDHFGGDMSMLPEVRENTKSIPILCKDFIIDESQIYEARRYGADAVLLIAAILTREQIESFLKVARSLNMEAVCEVHDEKELEKVLKTSAKIIGVNNRNLHDFTVDLDVTNRLAKKVPKDILVISESGITSRSDIQKLPENVNAVLVGTVLMKSKNISQKTCELSHHYLFKACGIRTQKDAKFCEKIGVNFIGLNFVPTSNRRVALEKAETVCRDLKRVKKVGVFQNQPVDEVNEIAGKLDLDYIQLSGDENISFVKECIRPVIKTVPLQTQKDLEKAKEFLPYVSYIIFDGKNPGSGESINFSLLKSVEFPFLIAGGVTNDNLEYIIEKTVPLGIDVAGGIETNGKVDMRKVKSFINQLQNEVVEKICFK
ncbi:MAG: bifunctional indole-3-glycerol-phosphate synthase TrpC/phosphoribosylanthranilate isomerase TrpF [Patescibacteria group bacterium]|nr:bifunctional indole-3-glycerol-phosphate synthase TrpC/phosphoribosylanthranilate isomerase TrpF [Patescibacteria group bacterium]